MVLHCVHITELEAQQLNVAYLVCDCPLFVSHHLFHLYFFFTK